MIFVSSKSFGQSDMVLWNAMIAISGLLEVLTIGDLFEFPIKTEEVWVQLWLVLKKHKRIDKGIS